MLSESPARCDPDMSPAEVSSLFHVLVARPLDLCEVGIGSSLDFLGLFLLEHEFSDAEPAEPFNALHSFVLTGSRPKLTMRSQTALHSAAAQGTAATVRSLLEAGAGPNRRGPCWRTPLHLAAAHGHHHIIQLLLEYQADPTARDRDEQTALHLATCTGQVQAVRNLVEHSACVDAADDKGKTCLHLALETATGDSNVVEFLIQNKANLDAEEKSGQTPFHFAVRFASLDILKLLLMTDIDRSPEDHQGQTPLDLAIQGGKMEKVYFLVHFGAQGGLRDRQHALNVAAAQGDLDIVQELLQERAQTNAADDHGRTALHFAVALVRFEVAKLLIHHAADVNAADDAGRTVLDLSPVAVNHGRLPTSQPEPRRWIELLVNEEVGAVAHGPDLSRALISVACRVQISFSIGGDFHPI